MASMSPDTKYDLLDDVLQSHLLELPAELRNTIYRYVLLCDDQVRINEENWQAPPLLRTCKQTREEASPIYYQENRCRLCTLGFNTDAVTSWYQHAAQHRQRMQRLSMYITTGVRSRADLVTWARRFHSDYVPFVSAGTTKESWLLRVILMFRSVEVLRDVPWKTVEKVVQNDISAILVGSSFRFDQ